jgi:hypothetical protein
LAALLVKVIARMLLNLSGLEEDKLNFKKTPINAVVLPDPADDLYILKGLISVVFNVTYVSLEQGKIGYFCILDVVLETQMK